MSLVLFSLCAIFLGSSLAQDCKTPGQQCQSVQDCCGGCCKWNRCVNTYVPCTLDEDPCLSHECPPGTECYLYLPPNCPGCDVSPHCRDM